ncbi:MAG TPA: S8 family serine peptidase [Caulobacteraceae bacterium]|nr:S8 family serine peptidase [Caulobacteraceae bacterium]
MTRSTRLCALLASAAVLSASAGHAQLLRGGVGGVTGGVAGLPGQILSGPAVTQTAPRAGAVVGDLGLGPVTEGLDAPSLLDLRRQRLRALIEANRSQLEADRSGNPVRRGEVIAIDPTPGDLARAEAAGFRRLRQETQPDLNLAVTVLAPPRGRGAVEGLQMLRGLDPAGAFELNHVFEPAGGGLNAFAASAEAGARGGSLGTGGAIGMVDGGVASHPCLASAVIEQRGFAPGGPRPTGHGTAIASLLVGSDRVFAGAARGRPLLVADVYGGRAAAGSAEAIVDALAWLARRRVEVVNISLVGPPNALLKRGVDALRAQGILVVAAVGNDGPAAPPLYPASYPGVVAVTGVDMRDRALLEAGRASHVDFAAPGADMAAASPGKGYSVVRGTSFAAPLVAARLALAGGDAARALAAVSNEARPGHGEVGRGVVCEACRNDPRQVHAQK